MRGWFRGSKTIRSLYSASAIRNGWVLVGTGYVWYRLWAVQGGVRRSAKDQLVTFPDLSAPSNSSEICARSGAYSFVDLNHHFEMEDMLLLCPLPLLMTTGLDGLLDIRQKNDMLNALRFLVEYTGTALLSWAGPGKEIWEERPENLESKDYFSWWAYLKESFAVWPLKLLRIYFPMSFDKRRRRNREQLFAFLLQRGGENNQLEHP